MASTGSGSKTGQARTGRPARWRSPAAVVAAGAVIVWILVPPPAPGGLPSEPGHRALDGRTGGRSWAAVHMVARRPWGASGRGVFGLIRINSAIPGQQQNPRSRRHEALGGLAAGACVTARREIAY